MRTLSLSVLSFAAIAHATHSVELVSFDLALLVTHAMGSTELWALGNRYLPWLQLLVVMFAEEYSTPSLHRLYRLDRDSNLLLATASCVWLLLHTLERRCTPDRIAAHVLLQLHGVRSIVVPTEDDVGLLQNVRCCLVACFGLVLGRVILEVVQAEVLEATHAKMDPAPYVATAERRAQTPSAQVQAPCALGGGAGSHSAVIEWDRIEMLHQVGIGAFGSVFAVKYFGTLASVKLVHKGKTTPQYLKQECELMLTLRHPHVCSTLGLVSDGHERHGLLMELMTRSLEHLLKDPHQSLCWASPLLRIALQVAQAMSYLVRSSRLATHLATPLTSPRSPPHGPLHTALTPTTSGRC